MRWPFRRRGEETESDPRESDNSIYIHLASDGGVLVIRGDSGEEIWTDRDGLRGELDRIKDKPGASLLYSREAGQEEPPDHVMGTFELIADYELPIQLLEEPHPKANTPLGERRSLRR